MVDLKAKKVIVIDYFADQNPIHIKVDTLVQNAITKNRDKLTIDFCDQITRLFEMKYKITHEVIDENLSGQQIATLGFDAKMLPYVKQACGVLQDPRALICFQYALLELQEPAVHEVLFVADDKWEKNGNAPLLEGLAQWGYTSVEKPEKGDIVLYFNDKEPLHMGIFLGDGMVKSKFGAYTRKAYKHPLNMVWGRYGHLIRFYRKTKPGTYQAVCPNVTDLGNGNCAFKVTYITKATPLLHHAK